MSGKKSEELPFDFVIEKDYREDLKDRIVVMKAKNKIYSYAYFASKINCTKGFLTQLFKLKVHISIDNLMKFLRALKLKENEYQFILLKYLSQSSSDPQASGFFQYALKGYAYRHATEITRAIEERLSKNVIPFLIDQYLLTAIIELSSLSEFVPDAKWIHQRLSLAEHYRVEKIRETLDYLIIKGIVKVTPASGYTPSHFIGTNNPIDVLSVSEFGAQTAAMLLSAFQQRLPTDPKKISWNTMTIKKDKVQKVYELFENFQKELFHLQDKPDESDWVYYISAAFFTGAKLKS